MTSIDSEYFAPIPPGVPYLIGLRGGDGLVHAVCRKAALWAAEREDHDRSAPRAYVGAACDATVITDRKRGAFFRRGNPLLDRWDYRLCPRCAWTVALADGTTEAELAAITPAGADLAALQRLMPDPLLAVRICRHLLSDEELDEEQSPEHRAQLLGHATAHRPMLLYPEYCCEGDCDHDEDGGCQQATNTVACTACSIQAGSWAGEWEGQIECAVPAPCAVLPAMAIRYGLPAAAEPQEAAR